MAKCLICHNEFADDVTLHRHLRSHKVKVADYYQTHFPRLDKFTKEPILFKDKEQYLSANFNCKDNFHFWFSQQTPEVKSEYCLKYITDRKKEKNLTYALSDVECRSLYLPSFSYMEQLFESFYGELYKLGFIVKYQPFYETNQASDLREYIIHIDSREQKPLEFHWRTTVTTLNFGDYSCSYQNGQCSERETSDVYFERKSLADFISSFGSGYERVKAELKRAYNNGRSIIVLVESPIGNALQFNNLPYQPRGMRVTSEFVFHNVRESIQEFPNIQFLFVQSRKEASRIIEKVYSTKGELLKFDLQLAYSKSLL